MENECMTSDELYHHGTKGQKWGRRLYQNKDGSLTALGRMRYSSKQKQAQKKRQATIDAKKAAAKTEAEKEAEVAKKKEKILKSRSAKELYDNADLFTYQELNDAYNKMVLENRIKDLEPKTVSKGQQFVNALGTAAAGAKNVSNLANEASNIMKTVKKMFGDDEGGSKKFNIESVYENLNSLSDDDIARISKRVEGSEKIRKAYEAQMNGTSKEQQKTNAKPKTDNTTSSKSEQDKTDNGGTKRGKNKRQKESNGSDSDDEPLTGEVFGEGTSRRKSKDTGPSKSKKNNTTIDLDPDDWTEIYDDPTPARSSTNNSGYLGSGRSIDTGESYVSGLLGNGSQTSNTTNSSSNSGTSSTRASSSFKRTKTSNMDSSKVSKGKSSVSDLFNKIKNTKVDKKDVSDELRDFNDELMKTVSDGVEEWRRRQRENE